ncbi:MAG: 5-carboxymethyl-2-hydroxymuconate Delta-isomerase [Actinomycetota bacterium]
MPHVIIEFSANVCSTQRGPVDIDALVDAVHDAALATGTASVDALRTRAVGRHHVAVGDRHPDNGFIAVTARIGPGRSDDEKRAFAAALIDAVEAHVGRAAATMMLSVEVQEIDAAFRINRNHLRTAINGRAHPGGNDGS